MENIKEIEKIWKVCKREKNQMVLGRIEPRTLLSQCQCLDHLNQRAHVFENWSEWITSTRRPLVASNSRQIIVFLVSNF
jgi:hypothetical protein